MMPDCTNFERWWNENHPFGWWASQRNGEPLPLSDRILVRDLCRRAYEAAFAEAAGGEAMSEQAEFDAIARLLERT